MSLHLVQSHLCAASSDVRNSDEEIVSAVSGRDFRGVDDSHGSASRQNEVFKSFGAGGAGSEEADVGFREGLLAVGPPQTQLPVVLVVCSHRGVGQ